MKHLVIAIALVLFAAQSHADDDPNYVYSVNFAQGFAVTRYAKQEHFERLRGGRPNCVVVRWVYSPKDENKIDDLKAERDRATEAVATELGLRSEVAVAATTLGGLAGSWFLYTENGSELAKALDAKFRNLEQSKYQIRVVNDAQWSVYQKYVEQLSDKK